MDLIDAHDLARRLMDEHGLTDWHVEWDNAKARWGQCRYSTRTISFSRILTPLREEADFRNTVLHEIAHALTPGHHHDSTWRRRFLAIGGNGARCSEGPSIPAPWTGVHDGCDLTFPRHRRPTSERYCAKCYRSNSIENSAALLRFVRTESLQNA